MAFTKVSDRLLKSGVGSSGNSRLLKLNSSGKLASSLLTGDLPAISGASLTSLPAGNLTGDLPALDGSALTDLPVSISTVSDQANTSTGYIDIPAGTTAQRPSNPQTGWLRFNTTFAKLEQYDGTSWVAIDTPPLISGANYPSGLTGLDPAGGETITINGSNFVGCTVKFKAANGTLTSAPSVTTNSEILLTVTTPALAVGDYDIVVTNTSGTAATLTPGLSVSGLPAWQSPAAGSMGSFAGGEASVSITVSATEGSDTIAYSVTTGSLPGGLSLSNAVISGTPTEPVADTTTSFTMTATDDEGQTSTRAFAITVTFVYKILNSVRFNDDDTAYLSRTPSSAGDRKKWTWSGWIKRGNLAGTQKVLFSADNDRTVLRIDGGDNLRFKEFGYGGSENVWNLQTTSVFRDTSAWYHIVIFVDTAHATAAERAKLYVNGVQIVESGFSYPNQNQVTSINNASPHLIGDRYAYGGGLGQPFDGYMSDVHFVDGQALAPTSFGEYNAVYNQWVPKKFTGAYGTNGFKLAFSGSPTFDITVLGSVQHKTDQKKFGSTSIYMNGSNDYLQITEYLNTFAFGISDFTVECWVRISNSRNQTLISKYEVAGWIFELNSSNNLKFRDQYNGSTNMTSTTSMTSGVWYHCAVSRTNGVFKLFVNGTQEATVTTSYDYSSATMTDYLHIGRYSASNSAQYYSGHIDEIRISNISRYSSNFTPATSTFDTDTNTLLLIHSNTTNSSTTFTDSSGFGFDSSSNSNNWKTNNLESSDTVLDTPLNNFATLNPLEIQNTWSNHNPPIHAEGNLKAVKVSHTTYRSSQVIKDYKVYWEVLVHAGNQMFGIISTTPAYQATSYSYNDSTAYGLYPWDTKDISAGVWGNGPYSIAQVNDPGAKTVFMWALDPINNKLWVGKNGVWHNSGNPGAGTNHWWTLPSGEWVTWQHPASTTQENNSWYNFGQDHTFAGNKSSSTTYSDGGGIGSFCYAVPTGFKALCTKNIPAPTVVPDEHFNTVLYTGTGGQPVTGCGFKPDFVWTKARNEVRQHMMFDSIRGGNKALSSDSTSAEDVGGATSYITSFDSDGFTVGNSSAISKNGINYAAWTWKAGGTAVSNTNGSITSSVSANTDAGFSIVSWSNSSAAAITVGHGLSEPPEIIFVKNRDKSSQFACFSRRVGAGGYLSISDSDGKVGYAGYWNETVPTSTVFSVGNDEDVCGGSSYPRVIAYCFHSVPGHSKMGKYEGNGLADGPFIYTGFQPKYVLMKETTDSGTNWVVYDDARNEYNPVDSTLYPNDSRVEDTNYSLDYDFVSSGFKVRTTNGGINGSGQNYIYMAFAEYPFKYSNAR